LKGVSTQPVEVPLVELHLKTDFIDETVLCGLISELPEGVDFLLGNDIWFKAHSVPCVVVTRAQSAAAKVVESTVDDNNHVESDVDNDDNSHVESPCDNADISLDNVSRDDFKSLQH